MKTKEIQDIYNNIVPNKYKGDYEYNRWFKTLLLKSGYDMTKKSIGYHVFKKNGLYFNNYIELGPGAGTWTQLFAIKYKQVCFDLVDISKEMLRLAQESLKEYKNINFFEQDFLQFQSEQKYDFFFSSRAIEYFPRKELVIKKIFSLLKSGGNGFIITKTPKYFINKILRRKFSSMHQGQISYTMLKKMLENNGFGNIEVYPVTMSFPICKSIFLNEFIYKIFYKYKINFISYFFSESYCIKFIKK